MPVHRQSMHVTFKLVDASDDERESSPEALASSICGWVLANHLDNTLLVFDAEGRSLGAVVPTNNVGFKLKWSSVPGAATPLGAPLDIPNPHLARLVNTLLRLGLHTTHPLTSLLEVIEVTREKRDSLSELRDANLATLIGRPLAVVRATVKIEVDKTSECEHSKGAEEHDKSTITEQQLDTWVGDCGDPNNGAIGCFLEDDYARFRPTCHPASSSDATQKNRDGASGPDCGYVLAESTFQLRLNDRAKFLTIIADPHGSIPLTVDRLPVQKIVLPQKSIATPLKNISVTFRTSPVLAARSESVIPTLSQGEEDWSWIKRRDHKSTRKE
ncbi:hypothetical protein [Zhongshania arctica]|uniref:Uncharacterized protein n=1 Tax=Zhongshania arctica TaxID=3238302 RepID=A0ABV3TZQ0_9GAMM